MKVGSKYGSGGGEAYVMRIRCVAYLAGRKKMKRNTLIFSQTLYNDYIPFLNLRDFEKLFEIFDRSTKINVRTVL